MVEQVAAAAKVTNLIGVRRPGYNPMLRKYEQRMPKATALYLARGRAVVSVYPEDEAVLQTPRQRVSEDSGDGKTDETGDEQDKTGPKVRPAIQRLAQPKSRPTGREEPLPVTWMLRDKLRLPYKEKNFHVQNVSDLNERFERRNQEARSKQRTVQHFMRVHAAHSSAMSRANETRQQFMQKEHVREERLQQRKRLHELQLERESYQRSWIKQLLIFHSAHLMLHTATVGTENEASSQLQWMQHFQTSPQPFALARRARAIRQDITLRQSREVRRYNTFALIRWFFDSRPLFRGQKCPAIQRLLLRMKYRKQLKYISDAARIVRDVIVAAGHVKVTMFKIHQWKQQVIKCQRMMRRCLSLPFDLPFPLTSAFAAFAHFSKQLYVEELLYYILLRSQASNINTDGEH